MITQEQLKKAHDLAREARAAVAKSVVAVSGPDVSQGTGGEVDADGKPKKQPDEMGGAAGAGEPGKIGGGSAGDGVDDAAKSLAAKMNIDLASVRKGMELAARIAKGEMPEELRENAEKKKKEAEEKEAAEKSMASILGHEGARKALDASAFLEGVAGITAEALGKSTASATRVERLVVGLSKSLAAIAEQNVVLVEALAKSLAHGQAVEARVAAIEQTPDVRKSAARAPAGDERLEKGKTLEVLAGLAKSGRISGQDVLTYEMNGSLTPRAIEAIKSLSSPA